MIKYLLILMIFNPSSQSNMVQLEFDSMDKCEQTGKQLSNELKPIQNPDNVWSVKVTQWTKFTCHKIEY